MHPYVFNPYALAAANLAHYNATAIANGQNNSTGAVAPHPQPTDSASNLNPYAAAAAMATNPALAQAAALNAYTRNMAAVQQQINGMVGLNGLNSMNVSADIQMNGETVENDDDINENATKNQKNKLKVEHDGFYNMKPLLAENILSSDYFKSLYRFKTYHEVIDETQRFCRNVEPLMVGLSRKPSTAFCILYKFFCMELTVRQIEGLLNYLDSAFVRSIGFLYLRYLLPPKDLWKWFGSYFDDEQEFSPGADGKVVKMKQFVTNLLQQQKYYSTLLPRIPVKIERAYKKRLLQRQLIKKRDLENEGFRDKLCVGLQVRAQWEDLKWYDAVIDECLENGKFMVTFTEYDDECDISIGQIQLKKKKRSRSNDRNRKHRRRKRSVSRSESRSSSRSVSRSRSRDRERRHKKHHRGDRERRYHRSRHRSGGRHRGHQSGSRNRTRHRSRKEDEEEDKERNNEDDDKQLEQMVRKKEMEAVVAIGRDYARRPTAYYHSLTLHLETGTNRKRSPTPPASSLRKNKSKMKGKKQEKREEKVFKMPSKEHLEKMRLLKLKYGDASKSK